MFYIVTFLLFITHAIAQKKPDVPKLDPKKFTVCTITLSSQLPKNTFEQTISSHPKKFNPIVELVIPGDNNWLQKACNSKMSCDQLIISGNYDGDLYGNNDQRLSFTELERLGCLSACNNLLKDPLEVFVFGNNSPALGKNNQDKFKRIFSGTKKQIYGLSFLDPSGEELKKHLTKYFKANPQDKHLKALKEKRVAKDLSDAVSMAKTSLEKTIPAAGLVQCESNTTVDITDAALSCDLITENRAKTKRVESLVIALAQDDFSRFIPNANLFLQNNPVSEFSKEDKETLELISDNRTFEDQLFNYIKAASSIDERVDAILLAENLGLVESDDTAILIKEIILAKFDSGLTENERIEICSVSSKVRDRIKLKDSDFKKESYQTEDLLAFSCLWPKDVKIQTKIAQSISNKDVKIRKAAIYALNASKSLGKNIPPIINPKGIEQIEKKKPSDELIKSYVHVGSKAISLSAAGNEQAAEMTIQREKEKARAKKKGIEYDERFLCAAGVHQSLNKIGFNVGPYRSAYMYAEALAKNSNFMEIKVSREELDDLPAGVIVVWGKNEANPHGHIGILTGRDRNGSTTQTSDREQPINNFAYASAEKKYGTDWGKGPKKGNEFRVFIPLDSESK